MFIFAIKEKEISNHFANGPYCVEDSLIDKSSTCIVKAKKTARKCLNLVVRRSACMLCIPLPCNRKLVRGAHVADLCCKGQELSLRVSR